MCFLAILLVLLLPAGSSSQSGRNLQPASSQLRSIQSNSDLEIRDGMLLSQGRPFFLFALAARKGVPEDRNRQSLSQGRKEQPAYERLRGLNFVGLASSPELVYEKSTEPVLQGGMIKSRIKENLQAGRLTDLLWAHEIPQWARKKWSSELKGPLGFYNYNLVAPQAREIHHKALGHLLDRLSPDLPFSLDLGNEPSFNGNYQGSRAAWQRWLEARYRDVKSLNQAWGGNYSKFNQIDVPEFVSKEPVKPKDFIQAPLPAPRLPLYYDWTLFNRDRVSAWFEELAGVVRKKAPGVKIHLKMLPNVFFHVDLGIDPFAMVGLSDFAGCDTYTSYKGSGRWAFDWQETWMALDMLRSIHPRKPIFNSENHFFSGDGSPSWLEPAPEDYFYATLMGEAIHGQYATLIWGRYPEKNVQDRPEAVRGIDRAISDIQRLSEPIATLSGMTTRVSIFFSSSTMVADAATLPREQGFIKKSRYVSALRSLYEELITSGMPVSFVYEEFPLATQLKPDEILILPGVTRMESGSFRQLSQMVASGTKVILYDSEVTRDEHGQPLKDDTFHKAANVLKLKSVQELTAKIKSMAKPECELLEGGNPARDVEWRYATNGDKAYLFVLNLSNQRKSLSLKTKYGKGYDLLDHKELDKNAFSVLPLSVRIIELKSGG
jgi:hypothetical protein